MELVWQAVVCFAAFYFGLLVSFPVWLVLVKRKLDRREREDRAALERIRRM